MAYAKSEKMHFLRRRRDKAENQPVEGGGGETKRENGARDGKKPRWRAEDEALLVRLLALGSEGMLLHLRAGQREHKVCDNIPDDIAVT